MTRQLHAEERGSGADTIVLLHGFAACAAIWDDVATRLSPRARTFAYDLPGHGASLEFPDAGPAKSAARAILADLEARAIGKVHVAGHSMGGAVAALMAMAAPERVASLTLLAPGGFGEAINGPLLRRYAAAVTAPEIRACLQAMSGPGSSVPDRTVDMLAAMRSRPGQKEMLGEIAAAITRDDRQGVIPRERIAALRMPVAVAWGGQDPVLPAAQTEDLPAGFRLLLLPDAGHMLVEEEPEAVCDLIARHTGLAGHSGLQR